MSSPGKKTGGKKGVCLALPVPGPEVAWSSINTISINKQGEAGHLLGDKDIETKVSLTSM